jgi:hypothetical protein
LIATAEFDPASVGAASHELAADLCARDGKCPPFLSLDGHNHVSEIASLDTADDRLGRELLTFVETAAK